MKTIGLLGGLSYQSTLTYYQIINERINKALLHSHSAKMIMVSFDFEEIELHQHRNDWETLEKLLSDQAIVLEQAGAHLLAIASNTMHHVDYAIQQRCTIPLVHIAQETAKKIAEADCKKVLLLGTKFTMHSKMYPLYLERYNIECIVPNQDEQELIHDIIYNELIVTQPTPQSKETVENIIKNHPEVDGVILGCTELPLLKVDCGNLILFDTTIIHCEAIVRESLRVD